MIITVIIKQQLHQHQNTVFGDFWISLILLDSPIERAQAGSGSCLANRKLGNHGSRNDQPFEENDRNESKSGFFGISCFETIQPSHRLHVSKKLFWNRFFGPWRILEIPEIHPMSWKFCSAEST